MNLRQRTRRFIATLALFGFGAAPHAHAIEEGELKAAIIFNILMFVDWPPEAQPETGGALGFCVGPDSSLHAALKALNDRPIRGYRFEVRDPATPDAAKACHAAFIDSSDRQRKATSLKALRTSGVLVFSDDAQAPGDATAVVLERMGNKIAFDVNLQAVRQARLQVSSKLLRLARVVRE
jgi:YfiR/HmsC-like